MRKRIAVVSTLAVVLIAAGCGGTRPEPQSGTEEKVATTEKATAEGAVGVTAESIVDVVFAKPANLREFCHGYRVLGDAGFSYFAEGYGKNAKPTARQVFEEAASRC
jgi:hypothetical protein